MPQDTRLRYFENYVEGWNDHDPEAVVAQFAEGGTYFDPNAGKRLQGREIGEYVAGAVQGFPDLRFEEHRVISTDEEDGLVLAVEWTMHGTHTGFLEGLPPTGNTISLDGVDVITVSEDGITSVTGYFDQETFADQLGLTFPSIAVQLPKLAVGAIKRAL